MYYCPLFSPVRTYDCHFTTNCKPFGLEPLLAQEDVGHWDEWCEIPLPWYVWKDWFHQPHNQKHSSVLSQLEILAYCHATCEGIGNCCHLWHLFGMLRRRLGPCMEIKTVDYWTSRDKLATSLLHYNLKQCKYPGDMPKCELQPNRDQVTNEAQLNCWVRLCNGS